MYQFPLTQDQVIQFHGEITDYTGMRAVATVGLQKPTIYGLSISDDAEEWKLRPRAGGENDDDAAFLVPNDYDAITNNVIWVRSG